LNGVELLKQVIFVGLPYEASDGKQEIMLAWPVGHHPSTADTQS